MEEGKREEKVKGRRIFDYENQTYTMHWKERQNSLAIKANPQQKFPVSIQICSSPAKHRTLNEIMKDHEQSPRTLTNVERCSSLNSSGNSTRNLSLRSPRSPPSLGLGIPCPGMIFSYPGYMISSKKTVIFSPPNKGTVISHPVRACTNGTSTPSSKSSPSLLKMGCLFSSIMKIISAGCIPGFSSPFPSNVIFVPFFHPGLILIFNVSRS